MKKYSRLETVAALGLERIYKKSFFNFEFTDEDIPSGFFDFKNEEDAKKNVKQIDASFKKLKGVEFRAVTDSTEIKRIYDSIKKKDSIN